MTVVNTDLIVTEMGKGKMMVKPQASIVVVVNIVEIRVVQSFFVLIY